MGIERRVTEILNSEGIIVKESTITRILEVYRQELGKVVLSGNPAWIGLGTVKANFRFGNSFSGRVLPTINLKSQIDDKFRYKLIKKFCDDEKMRNKILNGRIDFSEDDIKYFKNKYGIVD